MNRSTKTAAIITSSLLLVAGMSIPSIASAQQTVVNGGVDSYVVDNEPLGQAQLDQILAPIALYPDSLLSQILVAATYPLEVVQANRWRQANGSLTEKQVLAAIEDKQWDPSVKALTPFTELLTRLSQDLDWLQQLGDAFLQNEYQVLASVQELRQKAQDNGSIADNDYYDVVEDNDNIIIQSTNRETVYVPYYDSRVVYGSWGWNDYQPVYWHRPSNYRLHAGFYWSDRFYIRPTIFFGGFHWNSRNLVVNHHFYDRPYRHNNRYRNIGVSNYRHWNHNPVHRRGVRYSRNSGKDSVRRNQLNSRSRVNRQTRQRTNERRRSDNRAVSNNQRNRTNIHRSERSRAQRSEQKPRSNERRADRRERGNLAGRQQRTQKPAARTARASTVKNQESSRRRLNINRSAPRQQSARKPASNDSKANQSNTVANNPPKRTNVTRQNNNNTSNNNSRKADRKTTKSKSRVNTSTKRSHRKPN